MISSSIATSKKTNRYVGLERNHPHRRITHEHELSYKDRHTNPKKLLDSSRNPRDNDKETFMRAVSKDDSLHFEPPIKKPRFEARYDKESSIANPELSKPRRQYRNPTMKSYKTVQQLILGAFENRAELVSSSLAAFWTCAACLLEEEKNKSSVCAMHLRDKVHTLLCRTEDTLEEFGSNNMSQTLTAMGKIVKQGKTGSYCQTMIYDLLVGNGVASKNSIFMRIAHVAVHRLDRYDPQALSSTAITYARIGVVPTFKDGTNLFDCIASQAMKRINHFNPQGLSILVWAFATAKVPHTELFRMAANAAMATLHRFNPQNLSNMVWAFAKANEANPRLFKRVASESLKYISSTDSNSQNISNTLWAFATVGVHDAALFESSAMRIIACVSDFNPQELSNTVSAFANAKVSNHVVFNTIGDEAIRQLGSFIPQNLSNMVHAFATAGVAHPNLFEKIAEEAMLRLTDFNPQELANMAWAYAKASEVEPKLFHLIAKESLPRLDDFEPQHLSNTVWAFATVKLPHTPLFEAVADAVIRRRTEFTSQQISNLIWSFTYIPVGSVNQRICSCLEATVAASIDGCDSQFFANIAWSYAVANVDAPLLFHKNSTFLRTILTRQIEFNLEALCQIHQFILWRKELKSDCALPSSFQKLCYDAYTVRQPSPSAFQDQVVAELESIGLEPKEEFLTGCGYTLDALVEVNGEQVGIEVDGPYHFAGKDRPLGKMSLKHRQVLNIEGLRVVSVPYWEWEGSIDKQEYLRTKLDMTDDDIDKFKWIL